MKTIITICTAALLWTITGCSKDSGNTERDKAYAIYAEFAEKENKQMKNGLNRRVFNRRESEHGGKISLQDDGSVTIKKGTYHITGFSTVSMQATMAPVNPPNNYPGYCMVYYTKDENSGRELVQRQLCVGTGATSEGISPSLFDFYKTFDSTVNISVGHQAGDDLQIPIYLSVFQVGNDTSSYHVFARINIQEL